MFRNVKINIPLFDAIKHILYHTKFLKKLCITKRNEKLKGNEIVSILRKCIYYYSKETLTPRKI
jgi:hypothetical protein